MSAVPEDVQQTVNFQISPAARTITAAATAKPIRSHRRLFAGLAGLLSVS